MSSRKSKGNKVVSLVERSEQAKHAGVQDALRMAAQQVVDGTVKSESIIIILDQEDTADVHLFMAGIDMWTGLAMCEIAKNKLMFEEEE